MPSGMVAVGPFDHFQFTASAGNGVRTVDPSYVAQGQFGTPFVNVAVRRTWASHTTGSGRARREPHRKESDFFQTHVDQDLLFDPTEGRSTLASGSTRTGWSGRGALLGDLASTSPRTPRALVKATFDDSGTCAPYCGLLVPYIPDLVLRGDGAVFYDLPWKLDHKPVRATVGYGVSYVGRRPLPYGQVSDITFLSDASVGATWSIWGVRLSGQNLFDAQYRLGEYNYASSFQEALARAHARPRARIHRWRAAHGARSPATLGGRDEPARRRSRSWAWSASLALAEAACNGTTGDALVTFPAYAHGRSRRRLAVHRGRFHRAAYDRQDAGGRRLLHASAARDRLRQPRLHRKRRLHRAGGRPARARSALDQAARVLGRRQRDGRRRAELAALAHRRRRERGQLGARGRPRGRRDARVRRHRLLCSRAVVTINDNRLPPVTDPAQPGLDPICKERIVQIATGLTFQQGGALYVTVDPRDWFDLGVDFSQLPLVTDVACLGGDPEVSLSPAAYALAPSTLPPSGSIVRRQRAGVLRDGRSLRLGALACTAGTCGAARRPRHELRDRRRRDGRHQPLLWDPDRGRRAAYSVCYGPHRVWGRPEGPWPRAILALPLLASIADRAAGACQSHRPDGPDALRRRRRRARVIGVARVGNLRPFTAPGDPGAGAFWVTISGESNAPTGYPFPPTSFGTSTLHGRRVGDRHLRVPRGGRPGRPLVEPRP